jgi:hypothetical protein
VPHAIEGTVYINKEALTGSLADAWDLLESDIIARAEQLVGKEFQAQRVDRTFDGKTPSIGFSIVAFENFSAAIMLERTTTRTTPLDALVFHRGSTLHGIQFDDTVPIVTIERSVVRLGRGDISLELPPLEEDGYYMHKNAVVEGPTRGPLKMGLLGDDFYQNRLVETWLRLKLS